MAGTCWETTVASDANTPSSVAITAAWSGILVADICGGAAAAPSDASVPDGRESKSWFTADVVAIKVSEPGPADGWTGTTTLVGGLRLGPAAAPGAGSGGGPGGGPEGGPGGGPDGGDGASASFISATVRSRSRMRSSLFLFSILSILPSVLAATFRASAATGTVGIIQSHGWGPVRLNSSAYELAERGGPGLYAGGGPKGPGYAGGAPSAALIIASSIE